eukprot:TRINITY_DN6204_c0_g2_i2.p1 TRINITY_DN6204_c0_g2~~TRINITY_DN6204_c0_g2_i2.p1  ORF type:complete len:209 (-),score=43.53 TRINITY_DN6204_c0_g2_i2:360-986(-)
MNSPSLVSDLRGGAIRIYQRDTLGEEGTLRSTIQEDGVVLSTQFVIDLEGTVLRNGELIGRVEGTSLKERNRTIGSVDWSALSAYDVNGQLFVRISKDGRVRDRKGKVVASLRPFWEGAFLRAISYLFFIDPSLIDILYFSEVKRKNGRSFSSDLPYLAIFDKERSLKCRILVDGSVRTSNDELLGYINEDGSTGNQYETNLLKLLIS